MSTTEVWKAAVTSPAEDQLGMVIIGFHRNHHTGLQFQHFPNIISDESYIHYMKVLARCSAYRIG